MTFLEGVKQMNTYGGFRLGMEYLRMGLGWPILKCICRYIIQRRPLKNVYYEVNKMVAPIFLKKYEPYIRICLQKYSNEEIRHDHPKLVWVCWLQGQDKMPEIVRAALNSQKEAIKNREFRFIDAQNMSDYVSIPEDLIEKHNEGIIPHAMFSDFIRLELLIKYGGTWMDATVMCTQYQENLFDADFFLYQYEQNGLANWFITSSPNNPMLMVIRDVLYQYWRDYNVAIHYFIFHLVYGRLKREFPTLIANMPYADAYDAISLAYNLQKPFRQEIWDRATKKIPFHKLTWRVNERVKADKSNYYNYILKRYS